MKLTEVEVIAIAQKVIEDIEWLYDEEKGIRPIAYDIEAQIERVSTQKNHPRFAEYVALLKPYWSAIMDFPKDDGWEGRNMIWVRIYDDIGEPYEVGHRQFSSPLRLNEEGKYEIVNKLG
ncbi:MAG: hypothetical protein R2798_02160 [Chitinophagales bacterium]|nr:hypothetical protein [Bacteroidota bacterium]